MSDDEPADDADFGDMLCEKHDVERVPHGFRRCPYCVEERRIEAEHAHRMTRDPTIEPY